MRLTVLGCGSSGGVPRVGEGWGSCDPANPKNRRLRCSVLVERFGSDGTTSVLVDTSPDLREQLIGAQVKRLDGVLLSHPHADHTHGIDDLRPLCLAMRRRLDVHMNEQTSLRVTQAFSYIFQTPDGSSYPPIATELRLTAGQLCRIEGPAGAVEAMPFDLDHGDISALGFRFGTLAYTPDVKRIPETSRPFPRRLGPLDHRRVAPSSPPVPFQPRRRLVVDRNDASPSRDPHQLAHRPRLRDLARASTRACDAGL